MEKVSEFQKSIYFCFIDYAKAFDCMDDNKLENSSKDGNTRPPSLSPEKPVQLKKQQLEPDMVQIWERSTSRLYIVTLLI